MAKCYVCDKAIQFGHNVSHSKRHTPRVWRPNLRSVKITVNGRLKREHICTRCLRTQQKTA
ncbi:MAG: 50S ribosomal protein L28 [Chloroflexota bacterium]